MERAFNATLGKLNPFSFDEEAGKVEFDELLPKRERDGDYCLVYYD